MKKILMLLTMLVGALTAQAEDYTYLTFETTDGAKASVSVASDVTLTISGTTLTVGSQSFTLTNLSKMYFSNTDETTGIEEITSATLDEATDIYDLQGHKVSKEQMRRGVYIVKTNSRTYKMVVR
jgi:ethanolamine utilization protein EutA (predicted chaperonin)